MEYLGLLLHCLQSSAQFCYHTKRCACWSGEEGKKNDKHLREWESERKWDIFIFIYFFIFLFIFIFSPEKPAGAIDTIGEQFLQNYFV